MTALAPVLAAMLTRGEPAVLVTIDAASGSTPREAGAQMLVGPATAVGTIGGGRLEWEAIARARALFTDTDTQTVAEIMEAPLGPALGQCCDRGGRWWARA